MKIFFTVVVIPVPFSTLIWTADGPSFPCRVGDRW
uniref:Venom toxin meuTx33 n=1 Tax=Mesobuthus eupeus TaxID=34648 RepID=A0A146CJ83_MESEU|nr:venom toxin meuTx33 [Mesobuthus eupeus]